MSNFSRLYKTEEEYLEDKKNSPVLVGKDKPSFQQKYISLSSGSSAIYEMLLTGPKGSGKTYIAIFQAIEKILRLYKHKLRICIVRLQYSAFIGIVDKIESILKHKFNLKEDIDYQFKKSLQEFKFVFPNFSDGSFSGSELMMRAVPDLDAYKRFIHGNDFTDFIVDEISLYPDFTVYNACSTCLRYTAQNPDLDASEVALTMRATTNPWEIGIEKVWNYFLPEDEASYDKFYTKKIRIGDKETSKTRCTLFASWVENYHLPDDYIINIAKGSKGNKGQLDAFTRGIKDTSTSSFFGEVFDYNKTAFKPFTPPTSWAKHSKMCYDDGTKSPFAVLWYYRSDGSPFIDWEGNSRQVPKNSIFFFYEFLGCDAFDETKGLDWTHVEIAKKIKEINDNIIPEKIGFKSQCGPADAAIFQNTRGGKEGTVASIFEKFNLFWKKSKKFNGSRRHQAQLFRAGLKATKDNAKDYPHIYISEDCPHLLGQLPRLKRCRKDNQDVDNNMTDKIDHLYDAAKGAIDSVVNSRIVENH